MGIADVHKVLAQLDHCAPGLAGWAEFEDLCTEVLSFLCVPPLERCIRQSRTFSGIERRDAVFPNRVSNGDGPWGRLLHELDARMILFEFKNYDRTEVGKDEVNQTRNYLTKPMGRLAILCCRTAPTVSAYRKRNTIWSEDGKVILFLTPAHLHEMVCMKERGRDPGDLILDLVERFYLEWE
jgi:hypothetical protein